MTELHGFQVLHRHVSPASTSLLRQANAYNSPVNLTVSFPHRQSPRCTLSAGQIIGPGVGMRRIKHDLRSGAMPVLFFSCSAARLEIAGVSPSTSAVTITILLDEAFFNDQRFRPQVVHFGRLPWNPSSVTREVKRACPGVITFTLPAPTFTMPAASPAAALPAAPKYVFQF